MIMCLDFAKKLILFRTLSFGLSGILLAVLGGFVGNNLDSSVSLISFLINPLTYIVLAIPTVVSIYMLYGKNWHCEQCHVGKLRYVHIFGVFGTGLFVSFLSYFTTILTIFFTEANIQSGGQLNNSLWFVKMVNDIFWFLPIGDVVWILPLVMLPMQFMMQDIFNSYDGKSGIIFGDNKPLVIGIRWIVRKLNKKFFSQPTPL